MERLLGALSREDEDAEQVAKQTHRTDGDHEDPLNQELEHVKGALLLHLVHLVLPRHLSHSRPVVCQLVQPWEDQTSLQQWGCALTEKACRSLWICKEKRPSAVDTTFVINRQHSFSFSTTKVLFFNKSCRSLLCAICYFVQQPFQSMIAPLQVHQLNFESQRGRGRPEHLNFPSVVQKCEGTNLLYPSPPFAQVLWI